LGRGTADTTFLVEHRATGRQCAAKVIGASAMFNAKEVDRFRIEMQSEPPPEFRTPK